MTNHMTRVDCTLLCALLSPVTSNLVLVANRRTPLYMGTLHITLAVLPGLHELCHFDIRINFLVTLYQGVLHITLAVIPVFLNFALMANQLTSFWPVCVCLCVGNDAFLGPHCNLHLHARVSSHLDQVIHRRLNELFWVLTTILCSTTTG